tara:strand:- start:2123 stop:3250 length:1128 start_codon:yes stop_codon:yes gene_type:complete
MKDNKAQIQVTFNWVYILIAGAIILLFFVGIVVKQKAISEERLAVDVVDIMDSIFTGASVSEKTKQPVDTSGLVDYTLFFDCDEGVSEFGIKDQAAREENAVQPLFAPKEIQTSKLLLWSLPYRFPFKVIDLLFVTSINTKYFLVGTDRAFIAEFLNATDGFNVELAPVYEDLDPGGNYQIRIIDTTGTYHTQPVPEKLLPMNDDKVTIVALLDGGKKVNYYQKEDNIWKHLNKKEGAIQIVSLGGEKDAAKYAAIFSNDGNSYQCNMGKAFQRLQYINELYGGREITRGFPGGKLKEMIEYYEEHPEEETIGEPCLAHIAEFDGNLLESLKLFQLQAAACQYDYKRCTDLVSHAESIQQTNQKLGRKGDCLTLY